MPSSKGEDWLTRVTRECMAEYAAEAKATAKLNGDVSAAQWLERRRREELVAAEAGTKAAEEAFFAANAKLTFTREAAFEQLRKAIDAGPPEGVTWPPASTGTLVDALSGEAVARG